MGAGARPRMPERIGIGLSLVLFGVPAAMLWVATHIAIPFLVARGWEPLTAWFAAGGVLVFGPLLVAALIVAWQAAPVRTAAGILAHLRVRSMSAADWRLAAVALLLTFTGMAALQFVNETTWPRLPPHPPFMSVQPLTPGQYYIFALWLPFFAANIIGEELWWRGAIQPRQEPVFGKATWVVQGVLHGAFHISFGLGLLFVLLPIVFAIPWAVQRTRNTTVGIVIHACVNGLGFLSVTLGLIPA